MVDCHILNVDYEIIMLIKNFPGIYFLGPLGIDIKHGQ